mmetsp:Transcript_9777/g.27654  ORF Transcript_9777/g.27654 Transcript_9777/m.27654 type:complete len:179 (+) Transcript_9777:500-1036(+)
MQLRSVDESACTNSASGTGPGGVASGSGVHRKKWARTQEEKEQTELACSARGLDAQGVEFEEWGEHSAQRRALHSPRAAVGNKKGPTVDMLWTHISDVATGQVEEGRREAEGGGKWRSMCWFRVRGLHVSFNSKIQTKLPREEMQGAGCSTGDSRGRDSGGRPAVFRAPTEARRMWWR